MKPVGFAIEAQRWYTEEELRRGGVLTESMLARGRRDGRLKYREPGRGKRLYLGQWLLDWLERPEEAEAVGGRS